MLKAIPSSPAPSSPPLPSSGLTRAELLAQATYSGILRSRTSDLCTLMGPSIMAWIGDDGGKGPTYYSAAVNGSTSGQDMIDELFVIYAYGINGIAKGTYATLTSAVWAALASSFIF